MRTQSSLELITIYGFVVVSIAGVVLLLSQSEIFGQGSCKKYAIGFSEIVPRDWAAYGDSNVVVLKLENQGI